MTPEERNGSAVGGGVERDPRLDRAYRAGAREEPPAHLDAAILAAARREVGAGPRPLAARLHAWRLPVSIAAVVVLSVSVVTVMREEGGDMPDTPSFRQDSRTASAPREAQEAARTRDRAQQPTPGAGQGQAKPARPVAPNDVAASSAAAKVAEEAKLHDAAKPARRAEDSPGSFAQPTAEPPAKLEAKPPASAAPPAPRPFPGAAPSADLAARAPARATGGIPAGSGEAASSAAAAESAGAGPVERQRERAVSGSASGMLDMDRPPAAAPTAKAASKAEYRALKTEPAMRADAGRLAPLLKELDTQPAEKWLEKIDSLRREGRKEEAEELLAEFKRRFPDHPMPPTSGNP